MLLKLGIYELDIDTQRTSLFYSNAEGISCDCDGCQNYAQAVLCVPPAVQSLFSRLGIDPAKPAEVSVCYAPNPETVTYSGFYHICGTILKGTEPWIQTGEKTSQLDDQYRIKLDNQCSVYFTSKVQLLEDGFPKPVFQMEIEFTLPWVLYKPNSYLL